MRKIISLLVIVRNILVFYVALDQLYDFFSLLPSYLKFLRIIGFEDVKDYRMFVLFCFFMCVFLTIIIQCLKKHYKSTG